MKHQQVSLMEFKTFTGELKDVDTVSGTVSGYWSAFNNMDSDEDIIRKGAFSKSISERGPMGSKEIFFLNQHNWSQPLGKPSVLLEDDKGLYFESPVNNKLSYGKDALELYASGLVAQHSIGYQTIKWSNVVKDGATQSWDTYRDITEIKLYEGSCVTLGANDQTPFTGFKSLTPTQINDQVNIMMKLLRNGTLTDETFGLLEIAIKQYGTHLYELGKKSLSTEEPVTTTPKDDQPKSFFAEFAGIEITKSENFLFI